MTKLSIWFSKTAGFLALVLACASCASEDLFEADYNLGRQNISLQVVTSDNHTTRTPGDDNLNENRFVSLDYYFFAENNDTQVLKLHKSEGTRLSEGNSTLAISLHTYTGSLSDADLTALFGANAADGSQCYVYVLANLDATTRAAVNDKTTLGDIKRVSFQDANIKFNGKQDCFVMFGGGPVSLTTDATTGVRTLGGNPIMMTRDAAKIVLTVTSVQEELLVKDINNNDQVTAKWKSLPEQMHVMFYNGVNKSYVHSLINTGYHYVPSSEDDCYFDLTAANTEWRQLTADNSNAPYTNLTHQYPIYSYLADWRENEDDASYMILVLPWQEVDPNNNDAPIGAPRPTYYQIETSPTNTYYENYFYHISIKVGILGSFELPEPVKLQSTYMIVPWGNQDVESKLSEPSYLIVETNQYTMNNVNTASIPYVTSHEITEAYVKKVSWIAYKTFTGFDENGNSKTNSNKNNPFTTTTYSGDQSLNETFTVSSENGYLTLNHQINSGQYTAYRVEVVISNSANLSETVVFTIYPAIYVDKEDGGNAFVNGYFGNVSPEPPHRNNGRWQQNSDGSYRVRNNRGGNQEAGDGNNPYHVWAGGAYNYNGNNTATNTYGSLITGDPGLNTFLTRIKVTSFDEDDEKFSVYIITRENNNNPSQTQLAEYTYKITDPRIPSGWTSNDLHQYVVTASSQFDAAYTTQAWNNPGSIMVGTSERDMIAPEFLVSSAWGRCNPNSITFEQARKRCATYQEAGYPAGRWRLPTVAEISYIYTLQEKGIINNLFNPGHSGGYWSSEGYAVRGYNGEPALRTTYTGTDPVRCVYDVWYWGDTPESTNEFHAMPTN